MKAAVLLVDDDKTVQRLLTRYLVDAGYSCHVADDVISAKKLLASNSFDLLLSDLKMPGDSGLDLIKYAKENYPEIGRIMITAFGSPEVAGEIMEVGVYGYIIKPVNKNTVLITMENALRHMRLDKHRQAFKKEISEKLYRELEIPVQGIEDTLHRIQQRFNEIEKAVEAYKDFYQELKSKGSISEEMDTRFLQQMPKSEPQIELEDTSSAIKQSLDEIRRMKMAVQEIKNTSP